MKLQQKQAYTLIAANQKYLIHLCVKGNTGRDYSKLLSWYTSLGNQVNRLVQLFLQDLGDGKHIYNALNVLKCGLYSHNLKLVTLTADFLNKLFQSASASRSAELMENFYQWYVGTGQHTQHQTNNFMVQSKQIDVYTQWIEIPKKAAELERVVNEPGINSYLRAWFLFQEEVLPQLSLSLYIFGEADNQDVFWKFLSRSCLCNLHYLQLMSDLQHHI